MRSSLVAALVTVAFALALTGGADGNPQRIPWLTFNEVTLTGKRQVLSRHDIFPMTSSLSPTRDMFAHVDYTCDGCPYSNRLMVADVHGPADHLLVEASDGIRDVAWAPNGTTIAFASAGLWLVDADGTNLRRVSESTGVSLAWSPDSSRIAYMVWDGTQWLIRVLTLASGSVQDLVSGQNFRWSPDGTRIAYEKIGGGACTYQARVVDVSDGTSRAIACGSIGSWSPDARRISLVRYERLGAGASLWVVLSRGGRPRRIAISRGAQTALWSPDSRRVALNRGGHYCGSTLVVARVDAGQPRKLATQARILTPLAWTGAGKKVLYIGERCSDQ